MKLAAPLLALALLGCGPARSFRLAPGYTPLEASTASEALGRWNAVLPPEARPVIVEGGEWEIEFVDASRLPPGIDGATCPSAGPSDFDPSWDCPRGNWIGISRAVFDYAEEWRPVSATAHEIGHALGMHHVRDDRSVMSEANNSPSLTPSDLEECREDGPCD